MYKLQMKHGIAICTTNDVPNHEVHECFGLVNGTCIFGANFVKDFFARARDSLGGRVGSYESTLAAAQEQAVADMIAQAKQLGANAIVGVRLEQTRSAFPHLGPFACNACTKAAPTAQVAGQATPCASM